MAPGEAEKRGFSRLGACSNWKKTKFLVIFIEFFGFDWKKIQKTAPEDRRSAPAPLNVS